MFNSSSSIYLNSGFDVVVKGGNSKYLQRLMSNSRLLKLLVTR